MQLSTGQSMLALGVLILGLLIFFSSVNLTQSQAVSTMFLCLGVVAGVWFWLKPWR